MGEFPNNIPNKNVILGLEEGGRGALGDLIEIKDAKAVVIGVSRFSRNHTVLANVKNNRVYLRNLMFLFL